MGSTVDRVDANTYFFKEVNNTPVGFIGVF